MKSEKKKAKKPFSVIKFFFLIFPPAMLFALFLIIREYAKTVDFFVDNIAMPLRMALGRFNSQFSFSVAEIIYGLLILYAVIHIIITLIRLFTQKPKIIVLIKRLFVLFLVVAYIASVYSLMFGVDYYKPSFAKREGIVLTEMTDEKLYAVASYFLDRANEYSVLVSRDAEGCFNEPLDEIFAFATSSYDGIYSRYPSLKGEIFTPKAIYFSNIMSYAGFTGVYFPFTGESNINVHSPHAYIPATVTHELAHQKGITDEAECNFIGILAACSSGNAAYIYSGYLSGLVHLMNSLAANNIELYYSLRERFTPQLSKDWTASSEYWDKMELPITNVIDKIYDAYLKSFGVTLGVKSYSACVKLLVTYYSETIPIIPDDGTAKNI